MEGIRQNQTQFIVNGITTQIVITSYHDRHFVIVTQINKLGTLVSFSSVFVFSNYFLDFGAKLAFP
jgi:hypothetical protein